MVHANGARSCTPVDADARHCTPVTLLATLTSKCTIKLRVRWSSSGSRHNSDTTLTARQVHPLELVSVWYRDFKQTMEGYHHPESTAAGFVNVHNVPVGRYGDRYLRIDGALNMTSFSVKVHAGHQPVLTRLHRNVSNLNYSGMTKAFRFRPPISNLI
jgi:mRNA-degrading endonuclease toxin of MazEF toxin-antitoxin module